MKYAFLLLLAFMQVGSNFVLWHKRYSRVSRVFALLTAGLFIWTFANILLDYTTTVTSAFSGDATRLSIANWVNKFAFCFAALDLIILYRITLIFPKPIQNRATRLQVISGVAVALLALLPAVSGTYVINNGGEMMYHYGDFYVLIIAYFATTVWLVLQNLSRALRHPLDHRVRQQAKTIVAGLLGTGLWAIFFILVLPLLGHNDNLLFVGYFAPYIFTSALFYSIIKQGFLNFNLIIARSTAYALSLGVIAGIFVLLAILFIHLLSGSTVTLNEAFILACLNIGTALIFRPTRKFFDRISNGVFYRDAYDAQVLVERLNRTFVAYTDITELLRQSAHIIQDALKVESCYFVINGTSKQRGHVMGVMSRHVTAEEVVKLKNLASRTDAKIIVSEALEERHHQLRSFLGAHDIEIVGKLTSDVTKSEGLGFLFLGERRSGNPYTNKDLRTIETIINELVIAIQSSMRFEEIQNFNQTLQERVTQATSELRRTNEKLKTLDATKDEFISMASHQLRTPLTSVKGYLSMVIEGDAGKLNKQQKELLTQSFISSQRMVYLIADLLNLSRLNTGKFIIDAVPVELSEVVQGEIDQLRETAKARGLTLLYERPANFPRLMLDETKIHQVVMNFIDNAIYYTPSGGTITIKLTETKTAVEYRVVDNGIGVPKADQHRLFSKFYRAGNARRARPDGTGLGLFMAKKVIAAQGGSIIFESEEGKGSTFGFRFTKSRLIAPPYSTERMSSKV